MKVRYREWAPHPRLRDAVQCLWVLEHPAGLAAPERVLPDGSVELVLHYGDRFRRYASSDPASGASPVLQPRSLLVNGQRSFLLIEPTGRAGMIGVRFFPGAAQQFVGVPLDRLGDTTVDVADLWGAAGRELEDRVQAAPDADARGAIVEGFLGRRFGAAERTVVDEALRLIFRSAGRARVRQLARAAHVSPRTLERRFRGQVGLTPKELCRIVRFQHVLALLCDPASAGRGWADVAAALGFADQAHLTRDFRRIAGLPPEAFRRERHGYTEVFLTGA